MFVPYQLRIKNYEPLGAKVQFFFGKEWLFKKVLYLCEKFEKMKNRKIVPPPPSTRSLSASCKRKLFCFGIVAIPAVLCLIFICCFGVNVAFYDDFAMFDWAKKIDDLGWNFATLFAGHDVHRLFFSRLLILAIGYLSHFNSVTQMLTSFVLISLIAFVIVNYLFQRKDVSDKKKYFFITIVSFLVYSLAQWNIFIWGTLVTFAMTILSSILSYYFLYLMFHAENQKKRNLYFAVALLTAFIAAYSFGQGLISWIVGAILMCIMFRKKTFTSPYFITWFIVGLFVYVTYLYNFEAIGNRSMVADFLENPLNVIMFFFSVMGNSMLPKAFGYLMTTAGVFIVGFVLTTGIVLWQNKKNLQEFLFPVALILNGLFITAIIALGRIENGTASRYTPFSIYVIVGLLLIWIELRDTNGKSTIKNLTKVLVAVIMLSIPVTTSNGIYQGITQKANLNYYRYVMETSDMDQDGPCASFRMITLYWSYEEEKMLEYKNFMKEHRYNVFHKPLYEVPSVLYDTHLGEENNNVLQLDSTTIQLTPDYLTVIYPAATPDYADKITNLYLDIDGTIYPLYENKHQFSPVIQWLTQFDKFPRISGTGTSFISLRSLTPGIHRVKIKALTVDGTYYIVDPDITFESK